MLNSAIAELNGKMEKTISVFKSELNTIRAGKASPSILNRVQVEYFGVMTPINQVAGISVPEPRMITIQPYDATIISDIERAIMIADLGLNPSNDGKLIRLSIPMLTEERRKDLVKVVKKAGEGAKVAIRNERRHANDLLKKMHTNKELTDDDLKNTEKKVQDAVNKQMKVIDDIVTAKEADIMEV